MLIIITPAEPPPPPPAFQEGSPSHSYSFKRPSSSARVLLLPSVPTESSGTTSPSQEDRTAARVAPRRTGEDDRGTRTTFPWKRSDS